MRFYTKKKRSTRERVGFYTALSICTVALGMAAYSTYTSLKNDYAQKPETVSAVAVGKTVSGIKAETEPQTESQPKSETQPATTQPAEQPTEEESSFEEPTPASPKSALETMLTVDTSLSYPLDSSNILHPYSEETVFNKTLNQWSAHTGIDFACKEGSKVRAMGEGEVVKVYTDDLLGDTVVIKSPTYTSYYSGLKNIKVNQGDKVKSKQEIAEAGVVPSEKTDESHIHIAVKVGGQFVDPLSLIHSDE